MTQRERTLEELLSALANLLDQMQACPRCVVNPDEGGPCRHLHAWPYKRLRDRIKRELGRRPN